MDSKSDMPQLQGQRIHEAHLGIRGTGGAVQGLSFRGRDPWGQVSCIRHTRKRTEGK